MIIKSKIKWVTLSLLTLSLLSLVAHLSVTKFSTVDLKLYSAMPGLHADFASMFEKRIRNKKIWGAVKSLESLQPYANPRSSYPVPNEESNRFIYAKIFGGFAKIRSSICDLVAISRLLNATLVIPEIQESTRSKGISFKFKSFSYLYDEEQFIVLLKNDVVIVKSLPENLKAGRRRKEFPTFRPKSSSSPKYYIEEILPKLKKSKVVGLVITDGGCLQSILPPGMDEFQRLRCRVAFHALQFRTDIQILGRLLVERLQRWGQPFLVFHPGLTRDTLAYHGCAELFQDLHTELIQYRRAQMIKRGIVKEELSVESRLRWLNGSCPLMPEEAGILLRAMGYPSKTIIYLAGSETFGGQRVLIPLRAMFANLVDRTSLCSSKELSDLIGPETPLPSDLFQTPPVKGYMQLKDEWEKAGPRPRPLPPPPDRPIYRHEKEGWYGWITESETEPEPSPLDLREQAHRLLWDAIDFIVSVEADAFFPGFNNDGSRWPDFSSLVMGQRLYETASSRTYRPDRKILAEVLNITRENMYHPKHNWARFVQEHLNRSLGEEGLRRQSRFSKAALFLSHPLPECSCTLSSAEASTELDGRDGRILYGGEDKCPEWMQHGEKSVTVESAGEEDASQEYEIEMVELPESYSNGGKTNVSLVWDQDDEMDPND